KELFDTFYERAESPLKSVRNQTPKTSVALASLVAMHLCFDGEEKRAAERLSALDENALPSVLSQAVVRLKAHILKGEQE
ncbi:MAG: hypothetical protein K2M95_00655, partial [Clostridiales bacterium]|nr:hypothetical protein [Clostridiales bacterium]